MKKTLYIQIDNNSLPEGCGEDVEVLDCRCINDFCSMVGDALVSDLKAENGKPFYRLINPVGRLLMDFKTVDEKAYNTIAEDWYDILGNLLHKGQQEELLTFKFPQQYVDWLTLNESPYYERVGLELQKNKGVLNLSYEDAIDDIAASLNYKVSYTLQDRKDDIAFVVFSNPIIRNSSFIVKRVKFECIDFLQYNSWIESFNKNTKVQEVTKKEEDSVEIVANSYRFKMIFVKGGQFLMGATSDQGYGPGASNDWAKPVHPVTLSDYYIGETLVTQGLWKAVMGGLTFVHIHGVGDDLPVDCVKWDECQEFIFKLNIITGKKFRLPTEAEWEYAARGGNKSNGFKYAGSNNIGEVAWYGDLVNSKLHSVALKKANELGLYDMSGNAEEFCQDWYGEYTAFPANNPQGPSSKSSYYYHVYRGGCNSSEEWQCRVSSRGFSAYGDSAGIRLVLDF